MTKKDYKAIAYIINDNLSYEGIGEPFNKFIAQLCEYFKMDNPRFNETKFRNAIAGSSIDLAKPY